MAFWTDLQDFLSGLGVPGRDLAALDSLKARANAPVASPRPAIQDWIAKAKQRVNSAATEGPHSISDLHAKASNWSGGDFSKVFAGIDKEISSALSDARGQFSGAMGAVDRARNGAMGAAHGARETVTRSVQSKGQK